MAVGTVESFHHKTQRWQPPLEPLALAPLLLAPLAPPQQRVMLVVVSHHVTLLWCCCSCRGSVLLLQWGRDVSHAACVDRSATPGVRHVFIQRAGGAVVRWWGQGCSLQMIVIKTEQIRKIMRAWVVIFPPATAAQGTVSTSTLQHHVQCICRPRCCRPETRGWSRLQSPGCCSTAALQSQVTAAAAGADRCRAKVDWGADNLFLHPRIFSGCLVGDPALPSLPLQVTTDHLSTIYISFRGRSS